MMQGKTPNILIHEASPYLLQHAYNPVQWMPWGPEALRKAKEEQKLIIVSVGYSACHWCHVMEHESFEDEKVARIMNDLFISVKVDREERPDIDQVYMAAVQLMTGHGGWPLNCITLPDGRPLYGGTYFPKQKWMEVLLSLADLWKNDPEKCMQYAHELTQGVRNLEHLVYKDSEGTVSRDCADRSWKLWSQRTDDAEGGPSRAPKFPLPNNYQFLMRYAHLSGNEKSKEHVLLTLNKMADGGIYDHVGGGFARYSTDMLWKVPHFEKMLYDNGQLVSLYAEAYRWTGQERYREVVEETLRFIEREMMSDEGAFYSALDADSEGVEGKFYTWTQQELKDILGNDYDWFSVAFNVNSIGYWEHDQYVLLKRESDEQLATTFKTDLPEWKQKVKKAKELLLSVRNARVRPGLDDKILTSWNAMMTRGYIDAWLATGEEKYLLIAEKNLHFIVRHLTKEDGTLYHAWKNGKAYINGFLDDYAFVADACLSFYQATFREEWLHRAVRTTELVMEKFTDPSSPMFCYTSSDDERLIARKHEISDNVIPASNSVVALNLFRLGKLMGRPEWMDRARSMFSCIEQEAVQYGAGYSNWLILALQVIYPSREVVIVGKDVDKTAGELRKLYLPNEIFAGGTGGSELSVFQGRGEEGKTPVYICENNTCHRPVYTTEEAKVLLNKANDKKEQ